MDKNTAVSKNLTLLKVTRVTKSFSSIKALSEVSFELKKGEILGLVGENGAGKSTLVNILGGIYKKDDGEILINGKQVDIKNPIISKNEGINIVHQELTVFNYLNVAENVLIDGLPRLKKTSIINWPKAYKVTKDILKRLKVEINPRAIVEKLSIANKRITEIARAIHAKGQILILDEPTTALNNNDVRSLFSVIKEMKKAGISVIFISHLLDEILEICDRVIILRDGKLVCDKQCSDLDRNTIIKYMVGKEISEQYPKIKSKINEIVLNVNNLNLRDFLFDINFNLREGEILALYGLIGSGCSELARTLFGINLASSAFIKIKDKEVRIKDPIDAIRYGIGYISADRKFEGILSTLNIKDNINVANLNAGDKGILMDNNFFKKNSTYWVDKMKIKIDNLDQKIQKLSGGNQQKVLISRWLNSNCKILIFDEPTKGIDVGAKTEIYKIMEDICQKGASIIMISVDIDEIIGIADRALVLSSGKVMKELNGEEITKENLLFYASKI